MLKENIAFTIIIQICIVELCNVDSDKREQYNKTRRNKIKTK